MRTRTIIAFFIAFALIVGVSAMWSASTIERDGDTDANVLEDSGSETGPSVEQKKDGNKVVKALAAPFKAFGRLFGGHKDKDNAKLRRMSEKDAEKFESVAVTRVENGTGEEANSPATSAKEHLQAGRTLLKEGKLNEAISELSTAASMDPSLAEAHNLLAIAYDQKGLPDRAKEAFDKAVRAEPDDPQILNNLGFSLYQNGHYRAAIDRLKRAAKLAPNDERILNNLGLALCRVGKFEDAYKYFARANGEFMGRMNTATMLERLGRDEEAIKYYEAARRIDSNNEALDRRLVELYQRTGRWQSAPAVARTGEAVASKER